MRQLKKLIMLGFIITKTLVFKLTGKKIFYLFSTPMHGNIGDAAITVAEYQFVKKYSLGNIVEIPSSYNQYLPEFFFRVIGDSPINIQGGGFFGDLWENELDTILSILKRFKDNKITVFPQTVFFKTNSKFEEEVIEACNECSNLTILARENFSYQYISKNCKNVSCYLVPDIVLTLPGFEKSHVSTNERRTKSILTLLRKDREKIDNNGLIDSLLDSFSDYKVTNGDTVIPKAIRPLNRKRVLEDLLGEISSYDLIVTDRLHGMIFSVLTNRFCIVFSNNNYKIRGVYDWIKKFSNSVFFVDTDKQLTDAIHDYKNFSYDSIKTHDEQNYYDIFEKIMETN